jgi:hypothetical protein
MGFDILCARMRTLARHRKAALMPNLQSVGDLRSVSLLFVALLLPAGCSSPDPLSTADQSNASVGTVNSKFDGSAGDASVLDVQSDAAATACAETIDQYCGSNAAVCESAAGNIPRNWTAAKQEATSLCLGTWNSIFIQECGGYGILQRGGIDDTTVFYYDLSTSNLVRVVYSDLMVAQCIGIELGSSACAPDGPPTSICAKTDGGGD